MRIAVPLAYVYSPEEKLSALFAKALTTGLIDIKDRKRVPPNVEFSFPQEVYVDFILRNNIPHTIDEQDGYTIAHLVPDTALLLPAPAFLSGTVGEHFVYHNVLDENEQIVEGQVNLVPVYRDEQDPHKICFLDVDNLRSFLIDIVGLAL